MTTREFINERSEALMSNEESGGLAVMDGYDDCIVGIVERFGSEPFVVYDKQKVLAKLMANGMSYEESLEFHEFNQAGAWVGKHTPGFIELP